MSDHQLALLAPKAPQVPRWTRDAYLCSKTHPDCQRCPLVWGYGIDPKNCKIPEAVAWLIFTGVPVPDLYKKEQGDVIEKKEKGENDGSEEIEYPEDTNKRPRNRKPPKPDRLILDLNDNL